MALGDKCDYRNKISPLLFQICASRSYPLLLENMTLYDSYRCAPESASVIFFQNVFEKFLYHLWEFLI